MSLNSYPFLLRRRFTYVAEPNIPCKTPAAWGTVRRHLRCLRLNTVAWAPPSLASPRRWWVAEDTSGWQAPADQDSARAAQTLRRHSIGTASADGTCLCAHQETGSETIINKLQHLYPVAWGNVQEVQLSQCHTVQVNYKLVEHISVNLIKVPLVILHNKNKEIWLMCNWVVNNELRFLASHWWH